MSEHELLSTAFGLLGDQLLVVLQTLLHLIRQGANHFLLKLVHPEFDLASRLYDLPERHIFLLARIHAFDFFILQFDANDVVEASFKMTLDFVHVLRVCKNIDELIV